MFGWKELGAKWPTEQTYQVLEVLKQNRIRCRMPADDMFFIGPFHLPRPDRRWSIQVRRRDVKRVMAILAGENHARAAEDLPAGPGRAARPPVSPEPVRPIFRYSAPAAQPSHTP